MEQRDERRRIGYVDVLNACKALYDVYGHNVYFRVNPPLVTAQGVKGKWGVIAKSVRWHLGVLEERHQRGQFFGAGTDNETMAQAMWRAVDSLHEAFDAATRPAKPGDGQEPLPGF